MEIVRLWASIDKNLSASETWFYDFKCLLHYKMKQFAVFFIGVQYSEQNSVSKTLGQLKPNLCNSADRFSRMV